MYQIDFNHPIHVYFVGIGGVSMSGLARILKSRGFTVSGSDRSESPETIRLIGEDIPVLYGQKEENITDDIDLAVFTAAIHPDNPEYVAVQKKQIPALTRAQLLGQIMKNYDLPVAISGTHGKTTTTSMISEILLAGDTDPTLTIGGSLPSIGGNVRIGRSGYFIAEACEYTNSFLSMFPKIGIILNVDADHLDFFKDLDDIRASFRKFAQLIPEDGLLIINGDIPNLSEITEGLSCRIITFGSSPENDYYADAVSYDEQGHPVFEAVRKASFIKEAAGHKGAENEAVILPLHLQVPGEHNAYNALAALAASDYMGIPETIAALALGRFGGTDRRFQILGQRRGVTIVDDYAHHPTEITATLRAAAHYPHEKLYLVFQPHTYTRTKALMSEFARALTLADVVIVADIYAARETDTLGISSQTLRDEVLKLGHDCLYFDSFDKIKNYLSANCRKGDLLITMGAGNVNSIAKELVSEKEI